MELGERELKKFSIIFLIGVIAILSFFLVRPIIFSVIGGLLLAYILNPFYKKVNLVIRNKTLAIIAVLLIVILVTLIPIWFVTPLLIQQLFEIFRVIQALDVHSSIVSLFPTASEQFTTQIVITLGTVISKAMSAMLGSLVNLFLDIPTIALNLFLAGFVFFYALRDSEKFLKFMSDLSPLPKEKEKIIVNQFKGITDSIIYGFFIVGIVQGILTGLGLLIFGVENALVLTLVATFLSIIPILGPYVVWIPVTVIMFNTGNPVMAIIYLAYNLLIVSTADNVIRSYLVSRKTNLSPAIVLIGMIGGLFVFGLMGLLLGPLILAYLLTFLHSYKENNLYSLFSDDKLNSQNKDK